MPKVLFYAGTAFCLFLALTSVGEVARELGAAGGLTLMIVPLSRGATWAVAATLAAGLTIAALFLRMAALLAARNLFGALVAVLAVTSATASLAALLLLQWRIASEGSPHLVELHFTVLMLLGFFLSLSLLSLRPYFSIQASRFLSVLVFLPLPLFALVAEEMFGVDAPVATPATRVWFSVLAVSFVAIAVHCIRHRHLFLEMTNLRELLAPRVDPGGSRGGRIGGVAFDS
ncbi:MAG TPA: hypothetical protein VHW00_17295 [Thermoanaerobaculia bacterium]|nr:hypothetical protein [Thermoanaerobaculia bacterium]